MLWKLFVLTRVLRYYDSHRASVTLIRPGVHENTGDTVHAHRSVVNERECERSESANYSRESFLGRSRRRIPRERGREKLVNIFHKKPHEN